MHDVGLSCLTKMSKEMARIRLLFFPCLSASVTHSLYLLLFMRIKTMKAVPRYRANSFHVIRCLQRVPLGKSLCQIFIGCLLYSRPVLLGFADAKIILIFEICKLFAKKFHLFLRLISSLCFVTDFTPSSLNGIASLCAITSCIVGSKSFRKSGWVYMRLAKFSYFSI